MFEYIMLRIHPGNHPATPLFCLYHPPGEEGQFLDELHLILEDLVNQSTQIILCGDFNIHFNVPSDPHAIRLKSILDNLAFINQFHDSTHRHGKQLDLLVHRGLRMSHTTTSSLPWADHKILTAHLPDWTPIPKTKGPKQPPAKITIRDMKNLTQECFSHFWINCLNPTLEVTELDAIFHTKLVLARNTLCPLRQLRKKNRIQWNNRWFTKDLQIFRTRSRALEKKWRKSHRRSDLLAYLHHRRLYKAAILQAKKVFFQQRISAATNSSRALFQISKELTLPINSIPQEQVQPSPPELAENLAEFFHEKIVTIRQDIMASTPDSNLTSSPSKTPIMALQIQPQPSPSGDRSQDSILQKDEQIQTLSRFATLSQEEIRRIVVGLGPSSSPLDPVSTPIIKELLHALIPDITHLINKSLTSGEVPLSWKKGVVTPLLKKIDADPKVPNNYRPVTQPRVLARIGEHIVTTQVQNHLETNLMLHDSQTGFRPMRGTELAVADIRETLLRKSDNNHQSALILLDLSAAFDTVDHTILLSRLQEVAGLKGSALKWIQSFLSDRSQQIKIGENWSSSKALPFGVPQGSALSPLLFNIYLKPLATVIESFDLKFQIYADDVQLLVDLHPDSQDSTRIIPCLEAIQTWMSTNFLKLNNAKTEILITKGPKGKPLPQLPWPASWGPQPTPAETVRDLGIALNQQLSSTTQATTTIQACNLHLNRLAPIFPLLEMKHKTILYHAFIGSRLNYGIYNHLGATKKTIKHLQKVQNRAIRMIFKLNRRDKISPWRQKLQWLKVDSLIDYRVCQRVWSILHKPGPCYTRTWINMPSKRQALRPTSKLLICPIKCRKTYKGGCTFGYRGAKIWNELPTPVRLLSNLHSFKTALKTHLLKRDAGPPPAMVKSIQQKPQPQTGASTLNQPQTIGEKPIQQKPQPQTIGEETIRQPSSIAVIRTKIQQPPQRQSRFSCDLYKAIVPCNSSPPTGQHLDHEDIDINPVGLRQEAKIQPPRQSNIPLPTPPERTQGAQSNNELMMSLRSTKVSSEQSHTLPGNPLTRQTVRQVWGVTSPPLPQRNNRRLWNLAIQNKNSRYISGRLFPAPP